MNERIDWLSWLNSGPGVQWLVFGLVLTVLMVQTGLFTIWTQSEEYGHGLMVVAVLGYLVARRWNAYRPTAPGNLGLSIAVGILALVAAVLGQAGGIPLIAYYGLWLFGVATVLAAGGMVFARALLVPLLIVPLLFPLPNPLGPMVTSELQLISSKAGVWFIRAFGGSVFLEGNVLDMGGTKLLVAEACAGLRYLFPLLSLGAIAGFVMRTAPQWMRWAVFLVTIPITIFMNSFRIAVTGLLVESGGAAHTEGFLHLFEGWVVFIVAAILLLGGIRIMVMMLPGKKSLGDVLSWQAEASTASAAQPFGYRFPPIRLWALTGLVFVAIVASEGLAGRGERVPERQPLSDFPTRIGDWTAKVERLPSLVEEVAGASEYFYGDYSTPEGGVVNAYVSYYENQRHGQIPHSPKVCIPGGGWVIEAENTAEIQGKAGAPFVVNRLVTGLGGRKVISYYWLKQGPRVYRKEILARLDLVRLSLLEDRTDGALVRLFTEVRPGESLDAGDARLKRFASEFIGLLPAHVPD